MENKTSFDLNGAVMAWRARLAAQESITPEQARELEAHLRDAIAGWVSKGLTEKEAFQVAQGRLGQPEAMAEEFAKEDPSTLWRLRMFWMIMGLIVVSMISSLLNMATTIPSILASRLFFRDEVLGATAASQLFLSGIHIAQFVLVSAAPLVLYFISKRFLTSHTDWKGAYAKLWSSRLRFAVTVGLALAGLGFAQYVVTSLWFMVQSTGRNLHIGAITFQGLFAMILYPALLAILAAVVAPGFDRKKTRSL